MLAYQIGIMYSGLRIGVEAMMLVEVLLYVHRNRRFIRDGSSGRPPRLSHSSWALGLAYLWWNLCTWYLLAHQVGVTVGDSGLCCCVPCLSNVIQFSCLSTESCFVQQGQLN